MIVYSSSPVISGEVWQRRLSTGSSMYRVNSSTTCRRSPGSEWIGRGSPSNSDSTAITCETTSRTDHPGHSVARFQASAGSGATSSDIASMDCVHASVYACTVWLSVTGISGPPSAAQRACPGLGETGNRGFRAHALTARYAAWREQGSAFG